MTTILQRADITLKSVQRRHYWADLDVRVTLRCKQSILNLETPEKRAQAMNQKLFFNFLKKLGRSGDGKQSIIRVSDNYTISAIYNFVTRVSQFYSIISVNVNFVIIISVRASTD